MNYSSVSSITIIGFSGIVAQVLILRELLVSFYGNELTVGIILANWILSEAIGVFIIGKAIDRLKNKINVFIWLQFVFCAMLPVAIYAARCFKGFFGIPFGQVIGLDLIYLASFLIILPVSFCHGALFSVACKIFPRESTAVSIGNVYTWETTGTILGGVILTYLFIPFLNSFRIAFIVIWANLIVCRMVLKDRKRLSRWILILLLGTIFLYSFGIPFINKLSIQKQWHKQEVLAQRNSVYGNIVVTKKGEQYTFFYNGIPAITTPFPDITFVQEFGNLPLLFHSAPKEVLVLGSGAGGLISEILKEPVARVDYAELDPLLIEMVKKYPTELTLGELGDKRVKVYYVDGRLFVRNTLSKYDVILIGISKPQDLSSNRLLSEEFFRLAKKRLNPGGIIAFCLPGSLAYLSQELKDINGSIINAAGSIFKYVRTIPGDYNMVFASDSEEIMIVTPALLTQRIKERNIKERMLTPAYLEYRLNKRWVDWFDAAMVTATKEVNQDLKPIAVLQMLTLWTKQFSVLGSKILGAFKGLNLGGLAVGIVIFVLLLFLGFRRSRNFSDVAVAYAIATTGFFGMLANIILIFSFQVFYGYLYHKIGLLISVFMGGAAIGSIVMTRYLGKVRQDLRLFMGFELAIAGFSLLLPVLITYSGNYLGNLYWAFVAIFLLPGILLGLEFPLASKMYARGKEEAGEVSGALYGADLIGGWVAGALGGIVFLPVLGLINTCLVMVVLKLSSLGMLILSQKQKISA